MTREREIREAVRAEFGATVEYRRPEWNRSEGHPPLRGTLAELDAEATEGRSLAALVPARTDTRWCWDYCRPWEIRFLRGRVKFAGHRGGAPFPSMLVVMGPVARRGTAWYWQPLHPVTDRARAEATP